MAVSIASMSAADVMTRSLVCTNPQQDLREAEALLIEHRISGVPVVENGKLVGVLSANDITRVQVLMNSLDDQVTDEMDWSNQADGFQHSTPPEFHGFQQMVERLKVKDAMRDEVVTCASTTPLAEVARTLVRRRMHRVIVVDGEKPVGVISSLDLVKVLADMEGAS